MAPILLFAYNRVGHVKAAVASLLACKEAQDSDLYVYSDGPKTDADKQAVEEVRQFLKSIQGFKTINIIERGKNVGLAANIIAGVTERVNQYGRVIVVEDDLVVSPFFLKFMNDALECYADEPRIGHIQACDFTNDERLPLTFLIKWTGSWGWATWARAWKLFNPDGKELLEQIMARKLGKTFDFNGKYRFTRMLKRQVEGKNNSWAIRWNATLFLNDMLSLNVGRSLVRNTGFDGTGTNCGGGGLYSSDLWGEPIEVKKIEPVEENKEARQCIAEYYGRTNSFWAKAKRRIKRTLKGDFGA